MLKKMLFSFGVVALVASSAPAQACQACHGCHHRKVCRVKKTKCCHVRTVCCTTEATKAPAAVSAPVTEAPATNAPLAPKTPNDAI